jgi:histone demethylase JARID1
MMKNKLILVLDILSSRKYTYHEFEAMANKAFSNKFCSSDDLSSSDIEKAFWHEMIHGEKGTVEYGVNIEGSVFSCDPDDKLGTSKFNLKVSFYNSYLLNSFY